MNLQEQRALIIAQTYSAQNDIEKSSKANVGEIRDWGGKKYQKQASGDWKEIVQNTKGSSPELLGNPDGEGTVVDKEGQHLDYRVYKDGAVKVEGYNLNKHFASKKEAQDFLTKQGFKELQEIKKAQGQEKVAKVMREFKAGTLTTHGKVVTNREQAIAIALNEAGLSKGEYTQEQLKELIDEHEKLIDTLESPSKVDDKKETVKQKKELKGYKEQLNKSEAYGILGIDSLQKGQDPCWDGYEQLGMKEKDGKKVPNCVPVKKGQDFSEDQELKKAEESPKNGDIKRSTQKGKKAMVYMDGTWHHFGDSDSKHNYSAEARERAKSRHAKNLEGDDPRAKAYRIYWKNYWTEGGSVKKGEDINKSEAYSILGIEGNENLVGDFVFFEKGKRANIGEVRNYSGLDYIRTATGWDRHYGEGGKKGKKEDKKEESKGGKFKEGSTWEWHGKEWDPKKQENAPTVKNVKIVEVKPNGDIVGQFEGKSDRQIIREPNKYLKKKTEQKQETPEKLVKIYDYLIGKTKNKFDNNDGSIDEKFTSKEEVDEFIKDRMKRKTFDRDFFINELSSEGNETTKKEYKELFESFDLLKDKEVIDSIEPNFKNPGYGSPFFKINYEVHRNDSLRYSYAKKIYQKASEGLKKQMDKYYQGYTGKLVKDL
jgi:hypothetical protein